MGAASTVTVESPSAAIETPWPVFFPAPLRSACRGSDNPSRVDFRDVAALICDVDDVLCDATAWRRWLLQLLARFGLHTNYRCFFRYWDREYLGRVYSGEATIIEALRSLLRDVGLKPGQIDEVVAASQARRREIESGLRPLPGVRSALVGLKEAGVALGVLANSELTAAELSVRLARLGLSECFQVVVSSYDLKCMLPNEEGFGTALGALALSSQRAAFLGHDAAELAGASAIGLRTIGFHPDADAAADRLIASFDELPGLITGAMHCAAA
jgi:FMN phosphatase YigB (HAD superfamily)